MNLRILNKKETSRILNKIKEHFEINEIKLNGKLLQNKEGKIFLITKDINKVNLNKLRINNIGLYIANYEKELRLTIEGTQLFGKFAKKNIHEINNDEVKLWMTGNKLKSSKIYSGFVIIKNGENFFGTGKYKDNEILNYVPKERWIK